MINAGIEVDSFNGKQVFDEENGQWTGITVTVTYPEGQSAANNPIAADDVMVEPSGKVWLVTDSVPGEGNAFELSMKKLEGETTANETPGLGSTKRGGIITPKQGFVSPHWDTTIVDSNIGRIASMITMDNYGKMFGGDGTGDNTSTGGVWVGVVDGGTLGN